MSETIELSRRQPHEFVDDIIAEAIGLVTTFTRPGPIMHETIELLGGLRETRPCPRPAPDLDRSNADISGVDLPHDEPPVLSIVTIEGRGIWIELKGALVQRGSDVVAARLAQLGGLDFAVAVLDVRRVTTFNEFGCGCVLQFAEPIVAAGGTVHTVDPSGRVRRHGDAWPCGVAYTAELPTGAWWRVT